MSQAHRPRKCILVRAFGPDYETILSAQKLHASRVKDDPATTPCLIITEHEPVFTLGKNADRSNFLLPEKLVKDRGAKTIQIDRGGDITFHGPGQIVAYPVIHLREFHLSVKDYVARLERTIIDALDTYGIKSEVREGLIGVWVGKEKIASIGVHVSKWATYHGLALNINTDLSWFGLINPCGLKNIKMTSVEKLTGKKADFEDACSRLESSFEKNFGVKLQKRPIEDLAKPEYPQWLKMRLPKVGSNYKVDGILRELKLNTVCQSARCPNIFECFGCGTATFLILGNRCTRACSFCAVEDGQPSAPEPDEPSRVAQAVKRLGLKHAVVTSVTRDDLSDKGAGHFAETIKAVRELNPGTTIEVLVPDFGGDGRLVGIVADARPEVFNHNVETVPRLYPKVRPQADYARSLDVLKTASALSKDSIIKSGIMLGVGETREEVLATLKDLIDSGCTAVTIGQYLKPDKECMDVARYARPEEFEELGKAALAMGFKSVVSSPFARSSYKAAPEK